jgi:hypothetical protein
VKIGFRLSVNRPAAEQFQREAAEALAARIAEGRPGPDAWKPRPLTGRTLRRRRVRPPSPVRGATWYVSGDAPGDKVNRAIAPAGTEAEHDGGYDRPAPRSAVAAARPLIVKVLHFGHGPSPQSTSADRVTRSAPERH